MRPRTADDAVPTASIEMSADDYLRLICERGLIERYGARAREERSGAARAARLRARRHHRRWASLVLPDRVGLHQVCARPRHPGRPGPRLGGRLAGLVLPEDHRSRPDQVQADLRALPQPRPHLDAGYRHRLLRRAARRSDRLRHRKVRQGPRRADRHVRNDGRARRGPRRRPRARRAAARRRPRREADPVGPGRALRSTRRSSRSPSSRSLYDANAADPQAARHGATRSKGWPATPRRTRPAS